MLDQRCWVTALTLTVAVAELTVSPATAGIIHIDRSAFEPAAPDLLTSTFDGLVGTPAYPQNDFNGPGAIDRVFSSMRVGNALAPAASQPHQRDARRAGRTRDPRHEIQALGEVALFSESELDAEGAH